MYAWGAGPLLPTARLCIHVTYNVRSCILWYMYKISCIICEVYNSIVQSRYLVQNTLNTSQIFKETYTFRSVQKLLCIISNYE